MNNTAPPLVLLVDDERDLREPLAAYLSGQGFRVVEAGDAASARARIEAAPPDLVLLDIMMPGEDGLSLCRELSTRGEVPVILLTARSETTERIVGLEIGADDYVAKPFDPRELVARIRSVLRRARRARESADGGAPGQAGFAQQAYRFEGWTLDPMRARLTDPQGVNVPLSTAELRMLRAFLDHPQIMLDRDRLLDLVQGRQAHPFDRAVDNQISRLRRKLEEDSRNPRFIQTVRGGGYRFAAPVERVTLSGHEARAPLGHGAKDAGR